MEVCIYLRSPCGGHIRAHSRHWKLPVYAYIVHTMHMWGGTWRGCSVMHHKHFQEESCVSSFPNTRSICFKFGARRIITLRLDAITTLVRGTAGLFSFSRGRQPPDPISSGRAVNVNNAVCGSCFCMLQHGRASSCSETKICDQVERGMTGTGSGNGCKIGKYLCIVVVLCGTRSTVQPQLAPRVAQGVAPAAVLCSQVLFYFIY